MKLLVNIDVPEVKPAIAFYTAALGLTFSRYLDDDVAELVDNSTLIYLLQRPTDSLCASNLPKMRQYSRHWTPVHIDFVVEDLHSAAQRAVQAGALKESECVEWRGSRCITFSDPFGHGFCLIEFNHGAYL